MDSKMGIIMNKEIRLSIRFAELSCKSKNKIMYLIAQGMNNFLSIVTELFRRRIELFKQLSNFFEIMNNKHLHKYFLFPMKIRKTDFSFIFFETRKEKQMQKLNISNDELIKIKCQNDI